MSATKPPPHKRKLSQPDVDASLEPKKQKLTKSDANTIPLKTATKGKDTGKTQEVSGDDLSLAKKTTAKRARQSTSTKPGEPGVASATNPSNASEEFPNGHLYCHQCNKKRDATRVISCTEAPKKCKSKYCKPCLANRYGEDIDEIKQTPPSGRGKTKVPYTFKCPRCRGICNCRTCRRAQGLEPTGNLTNAARKVGISAAQLLDVNPDQKGILPGQGQERKRAKAAASAAPDLNKSTVTLGATSSKPTEKPQTKPKPKPAKPLIPVIQPTWTKLSNVPREIAFGHLEERMFIREFMVRFSSLMDKEAKMHLDELAEVIGDGSVEWVVDETQPKKGQDTSDIPLVSWVSERCMRSVILGLLGIYAEDATGPLKKSLRAALKEIKNSSANMTKIWATLASLRHEHPNDFTYSDPLPPPTSMPVYNTRRGALNQDAIPVGHSAQLVHIVLDLIDGLMTGGSKSLKVEIDKGVNEAKDITKLGKEAIVRENERWTRERTRLGTTKPPRPFRDAHKIRLDDLEKAQHTLISSPTSRFSPLGHDNEGRIYFAFSPSITEKDAASDIISDDLEEVGTAPKKTTGGGRGRRTAFTSGGVGAMDESKREELWNWNWFVAVWGRRPEGAVVAPDPYYDEDGGDTTDEDEDDDEDDGPGGNVRWWAFWRPADIRNLSRWIAHCHGLDHEDHDHDLKEGEKEAPRPTHKKVSNGILIPPTAASSTVGTLSDRASTANFDHDAMDVDEGHETDDPPREGSPLTDFDESSDENGNKKLLDAPLNGKPSKRAVKELVGALSGYAQLLEWRVQRGERERKARQKD